MIDRVVRPTTTKHRRYLINKQHPTTTHPASHCGPSRSLPVVLAIMVLSSIRPLDRRFQPALLVLPALPCIAGFNRHHHQVTNAFSKPFLCRENPNPSTPGFLQTKPPCKLRYHRNTWPPMGPSMAMASCPMITVMTRSLRR